MQISKVDEIYCVLKVVPIKTHSEHLLKYRNSYLPMWHMHFVKLWKTILNCDS